LGQGRRISRQGGGEGDWPQAGAAGFMKNGAVGDFAPAASATAPRHQFGAGGGGSGSGGGGDLQRKDLHSRPLGRHRWMGRGQQWGAHYRQAAAAGECLTALQLDWATGRCPTRTRGPAESFGPAAPGVERRGLLSPGPGRGGDWRPSTTPCAKRPNGRTPVVEGLYGPRVCALGRSGWRARRADGGQGWGVRLWCRLQGQINSRRGPGPATVVAGVIAASGSPGILLGQGLSRHRDTGRGGPEWSFGRPHLAGLRGWWMPGRLGQGDGRRQAQRQAAAERAARAAGWAAPPRALGCRSGCRPEGAWPLSGRD